MDGRFIAELRVSLQAATRDRGSARQIIWLAAQRPAQMHRGGQRPKMADHRYVLGLALRPVSEKSPALTTDLTTLRRGLIADESDPFGMPCR